MKITDLMIRLDSFLTNQEIDSVTKNSRQKQQTVEDLLDKPEYYLSDGGYSRIWFTIDSDDRSYFHLTENSTNSVKLNWESDHIKNLRRELSELIHKWVQEQ